MISTPMSFAELPTHEEESHEEEIPEMPEQQRKFFYWMKWDPLKKVRECDIRVNPNELEMLASYSHDFESEYLGAVRSEQDAAQAAKQESEGAESDGPVLVDDVWNTSELTRKATEQIIVMQQNQAKERELVGDINYLQSLERKQRMIDFMKEYEIDFIDEEGTGSESQERLSKIWDSFGFTVQQRLAMVLKYTRDPDESSKLSDALDMWQRGYDMVCEYQKSYKELKEFCCLAAVAYRSDGEVMKMKELVDSLGASVLAIADNLKRSFGDEMVIKKMSAFERIQHDKMKMAQMIKGFQDNQMNHSEMIRLTKSGSSLG
jgi:hypothetical protein